MLSDIYIIFCSSHLEIVKKCRVSRGNVSEMPWIPKHPRHSRRKRRVTNVNATLGATSLSFYTFPRARTRNRLIQTRRNRRAGRRRGSANVPVCQRAYRHAARLVSINSRCMANSCHWNARRSRRVIKGKTEQPNLLHCHEHTRAAHSRNIGCK